MGINDFERDWVGGDGCSFGIKLGLVYNSRLCIARAAINLLIYIHCVRLKDLRIRHTTVTGLGASCAISALVGLVTFECLSMPPMSPWYSRTVRAT